ncbi:hypothetical protein PI124_g18197 [Phytophthora idaei]|nr:hypothetical protein PI125_g18855 [Phytophthora idaei]KAG3137007.1 hypothetical protein PI126_g17569 [Phytophthora idaei]KAG3236791.1 hypothetical protein PI124_g18197 [Phytophthora idaei]
MASQVPVFVFGMHEGMTQYRLTRAVASTFEEIFTLAHRVDYMVTMSYARSVSVVAREAAPKPIEINAIDSTNSRRRQASRAGGARSGRSITCFRYRKLGPRAYRR